MKFSGLISRWLTCAQRDGFRQDFARTSSGCRGPLGTISTKDSPRIAELLAAHGDRGPSGGCRADFEPRVGTAGPPPPRDGEFPAFVSVVFHIFWRDFKPQKLPLVGGFKIQLSKTNMQKVQQERQEHTNGKRMTTSTEARNRELGVNRAKTRPNDNTTPGA